MTKEANKSQLLDFGLNTKTCTLANPYIIKTEVWAKVVAILLKFLDAKLPRKASRVNYIGACTENRHRWSRRVF